MTRLITITATHPRSGWTRMAGTTVPVHAGPSTEQAISEFDALQCIAAGQGEWTTEEAEDESQRRE